MKRSDEILEATLQLIPQYGLSGIRISHIAEQASCSPGIIYHYFSSKEEIILTLGNKVMSGWWQALDLETLLTLSPFDRLKRMWLNTFYFFVNHPNETIFLEQFKNSPIHEKSPDDENKNNLIQLLEEDIAQGYLKNFPFMVMYELTVTVAIRLAKQVGAGQLQLDEALLNEVATASCQSLLAD